MKKRNNIYCLFTIIFFIFLLIGLLPTQIKSGTPFGLGLFTDSLKQYLIFMQDFVSNIKGALAGEPLQIYRFDIGLGSDFFLSYGYYSLFDPLTIMAYLIPLKHLEFSFYLITIIRLYLSGTFIIILARKFGVKDRRALLSTAIFYCFNITVLYSAFRHPLFINGPMLLPLVILGAEKIFRGESPYLLIISSFLGIITQFYFFIYTSFGFELFVLIRLFPKIKNESFKSFFKTFIYINLVYCLGTFLGGFVLIPQLMGTISGGRTASKGFVFYNSYDYLTYLLSFLVPVIGSRYSPTIGNFFVLFIVLIYFFNRKKTWEKYFFLILVILLFIPFFGYLINICSYITNRWTYLIILPTALMLGKVIDKPEEVEDKAISSSYKTFLVLGSLLAGFGILTFAEFSDSFFIFLLILIPLILLEYIMIRVIVKKNFGTGIKKYLNSKLINSIILILGFLMIFGKSFAGATFLTVSEGLSSYSDRDSFEAIRKDEDFFRVDQNKYVLNSDFLSNDNLIYGFPATYSYNTMNNGHINDMIEFFNIVNHNNTVGYNGFNERSALNSINHVKYLIVRESEKIRIPSGFRLFQTIRLEKFEEDRFNKATNTGNIEYQDGQKVYEDAYIYINENFLNFGFVYHSYIKAKDLEEFSAVGRENVLLDAVILDQECDLPKYFPDDQIRIEPKNLVLDNLRIEEGRIISGKGGGSIGFLVENVREAELYLETLGLVKDEIYQDYTIYYETETSFHKEKHYAYGKNFYFDNRDHLINVGYFQEDDVNVRITFEEGGYGFKSIGYYINPVSELQEKIEKLNRESLEDLRFFKNGLSGNISLEKPGLLFLSLPYTKGFTAYVDGVKTEIVLANIGYMGVFLETGDHEIKLIYETPGMKAGLLLSLLSLASLSLIMIYRGFIKINKQMHR